MTAAIEDQLRECRFSYTKEVDNQGRATFHLPFEISCGTVFVRLHVDETVFASYVFLRSLDSIAVPSRRDLFLALLRLNSQVSFARVSIWGSTEDEVEWVLVDAQMPSRCVTPEAISSLVQQTVNLADQVATTIQLLSTTAQRQLAE